jgi:hypothetical protein
VGWLQRRRQEKSASELAAWQARFDELNSYVSIAQTWDGELLASPDDAGGMVLKPAERVFWVLRGASLIESRHAPGHYQGGSQGFSFHVMKGVTYRVGANRGTFTEGPETPSVIDVGNVVITSKRAVFLGQKETREWSFDKLIGVTDQTEASWTALSVSNRQKTSGFGYGEDVAEETQFRLHLALAISSGNRDAFVTDVSAQRDAFAASRPAIPPAP